jgi:hypothetical protein
MSELLTKALQFANQGIVCVPVSQDGSKRPGLSSWKQYQEVRPTPTEILNWFGSEQHGIGVITGSVSGNLEMLELEGRAVAEKMHLEIAEICNGSGLGDLWERLNSSYVEATPSGGLHWLYKVEGELPGNTKLARRPGENGGVDVLAETRGEGGFCITAPSGGSCHPSGGAWQMLRGSIETITTLSHAERDALHTVFKMFDSMPKPESVAVEVATRSDGVLTAGDDYNQRTTWDEILIPLGWKKAYTQGEKTTWIRPGKDFGISATTNYQGNDKLMVFSTSTAFDSERSYDKFGALVHLQYGGDFKRAATDLRSQGYGSQGLKPIERWEGNGLIGEKYEDWLEQEEISKDSSWKPVALSDYYDGLFQEVKANILTRTDGKSLIYAGKVHSFYGESESGKSWVAQIATAELLKSDKKVIYIDFESDPQDIVKRLKSLGVSRANLLQYLTYIRPETARQVDDPYWDAILAPDSASLVVIDGVTESLTMWGGETVDNDSITKWMRQFPRKVAQESGAAVILIDHITKNAETRGRFAIGGQAKLATIDGAAYIVEPIEVLSPGRVGTLTLRVTKDRIGDVRASAGMYRKSDRTQEAAVFTIDSTRAQMQYIVGAPTSEEQLLERTEFKKMSEMAEFIHNNPGCSRRELNDGVKGDKGLIGERLETLEKNGFIENKGSVSKSSLWITSAGMDKYDLVDAKISYIGGVSE